MYAAVALIALALGYKVFADAHKEKEGLKLLGQIIGVVVMLAAVLCMLCGAVKCMYKSQCSIMSKSSCPLVSPTAKAGCPIGDMSADPAK